MLAACSCVHAAVVNIDFQGSNGTTSTATNGAIPTAGNVWNVNGPGYDAEVPLVSSEGLPVTPTLWTDGVTGTLGEGDALYEDYLAGNVELRGLAPNQDYTLVLYNAANIDTWFRLRGPWNLAPTSASPPFPCPLDTTDLPGTEGCNFFRGTATTDELGIIAINANWGAIGGLQIDLGTDPNPEPGILLLNAIAGLLGLSRRRR